MTHDEFRVVLERLDLSQVAASRILRVDERTVRRWAAGDREIPGPVVAFLWLVDGCPAARRFVGIA